MSGGISFRRIRRLIIRCLPPRASRPYRGMRLSLALDSILLLGRKQALPAEPPPKSTIRSPMTRGRAQLMMPKEIYCKYQSLRWTDLFRSQCLHDNSHVPVKSCLLFIEMNTRECEIRKVLKSIYLLKCQL